jgi:hypothetical protein
MQNDTDAKWLTLAEANAAWEAHQNEYREMLAAPRLKREDLDRIRTERRGAEQAITELFRLGLEFTFKIKPGALADRLWEKSWSDGHHAGYNEVYNYYYENVQLLGGIQKALWEITEYLKIEANEPEPPISRQYERGRYDVAKRVLEMIAKAEEARE